MDTAIAIVGILLGLVFCLCGAIARCNFTGSMI